MRQRSPIHKVVVPIAGLGKRMGPLCRAVPKALFPLGDERRGVRPIVHRVCVEASRAGAERVAIIVSPRDVDLLHRYFAAAREQADAELPLHIDFLTQAAPRGLGDALALAADYVGREPFLLMLGDHVHIESPRARPCALQVVEAFAARGGAAMVGMQAVRPEALPRVGAARGECLGDRIYRCRELIEKPDPAVAAQRLVTPGLGPDRYLAHAGIYLFTPEIFDCLRQVAQAFRRAGEEIELTDAQKVLLTRHPEDCYLVHIDGQVFDAGIPAGWMAAQAAFGAPKER